MPTQKKGDLFIVIEGIDGTGKSSITSLLQDYLSQHGKEIILLKEPGDSEAGEEIKKIIQEKKANSLTNEQWTELFTQDRKNTEEKVKEALSRNKIVILDRYYYSTLAYQLKQKDWQEYASKFLKPTLTIILDNDVETSLSRINSRIKLKEKNEKNTKKAYFEKKKILKEVRKKFLAIPSFLNDNIKIIDSSRPLKEVWFDVKNEINKLIK